MTEIVIAGAGGCGREVYDLALATFPTGEYRIRGFLSDQPDDLDPFPEVAAAAPIVGPIHGYRARPGERALLAVGTPGARREVAEALLAGGASFLTLLHPLAYVSPRARIGEGVIAYPFAFVDCEVELGDFSLVLTSAVCGHDVQVGKYSVLCPASVALGFSRLGEGSLLGSNATVVPHKSVGDLAKVSANTAVLKDVPNGALAFGVPARLFQDMGH